MSNSPLKSKLFQTDSESGESLCFSQISSLSLHVAGALRKKVDKVFFLKLFCLRKLFIFYLFNFSHLLGFTDENS